MAIKKTNKTFDIIQTYFFPIKLDTDEKQKKLLISSHLKTLADLHNNRETKYILSVSQNAISTERLGFPFKEKYKILKSLPYEMEEKLSLFDYKNMISDIKTIDSPETGPSEKKRSILVFSIFKDNISNLLNEIKPVGIDPYILTCEASALTNLFEKTKEHKKEDSKEGIQQEKEQECHLYLKIGHSHSMAMIFAHNCLQNVYSFEWGVSTCIRKIAIKYEVPINKAMEQFYEKAFVLTQTKGYTGSQIAFSKVIQEALENMIDKLRLLLLQMEGEGTYVCKKIFLCGGGAQIRNLQALLSIRLGVPVSRIEHPPGFPNWNLRDNNEKQNNLITALGAAMEGLKKPRNPAINFLKQEFAVKFNSFSFIIHQWKKPLVLGISSLVLLFFYANLRNQQSENLSDKTHKIFQKKSIQIAKLSPRQISIERIQHFIKNKREWKKQIQLKEALSRIPSALDKMKNISVAIKKQESWKLQIQELNIMGDKIEIYGNISTQYLATFKKNLIDLAENGDIKTLLKKQPNTIKSATQPKETTLDNNKPDIVFFRYSFTQKQG